MTLRTLALITVLAVLSRDAVAQSVPTPVLEYRIPKKRIIEEAHKILPDSVAVDDYSAGNKLIYRDVNLRRITLTGTKPTLAFDGPKLTFTCSPSAKGDLSLLYEHIWIESQVKTVAKVLGHEIKQAVPVARREWRPRSNPFVLKAGLTGTIDVSIVGDKRLNDKRLQLDVQCLTSRIEKVDINTGDGLRGFLNDVLLIGGAAPNGGPLNPLICKAVTRKITIDPFFMESKESRERLAKISVTELGFTVEGDDLVIRGKGEIDLK